MRISDWSSDVCSSDLADIEDLLDQAVHDVFVGTPGPEQTGQRDVDDDQGGGEEGDLATEQPEPAVDVAVEGVEEAVDDADEIGRATSELQSLMRISYAVFCLKKKQQQSPENADQEREAQIDTRQ